MGRCESAIRAGVTKSKDLLFKEGTDYKGYRDKGTLTHMHTAQTQSVLECLQQNPVNNCRRHFIVQEISAERGEYSPVTGR